MKDARIFFLSAYALLVKSVIGKKELAVFITIKIVLVHAKTTKKKGMNLMAKNDFLAKQKARDQAVFDVGERIGMQKMWDYIQMGLRNTKVTGAVPFGRGQFERLYAFTNECADEYHVAFTADKMADYKQEEMDARLREIWGSDLQSFYERYPELKRYDYNKARKGWAD